MGLCGNSGIVVGENHNPATGKALNALEQGRHDVAIDLFERPHFAFWTSLMARFVRRLDMNAQKTIFSHCFDCCRGFGREVGL